MAHLLQDPLLAFADISARRVRLQAMRIGQHGGKDRGIFGREPRRGLVKIPLRRRFHSIDAITEFGDVQVRLQNPALTPARFD